ncbi:hypothetical protein [Antarctobacter jejuensis]|uniref:hypothetical protein n=1 Tax=Antarctobacter jejuensis TaxID=1439938 RepID=UPI003FCF918F
MPDTVYQRTRSFYWHPARWRRAIENQVPRKAVRDWVNRLRFGDAVPPSDAAIFVDLADVAHIYDKPRGRDELRRRDSARVLAGDWDLARRPVGEDSRFISCRMRFQEGADWEETPKFRQMVAELARGLRPDGCADVNDVRARYAALDRVYEEIRARGRLLLREELPECFRREHGGILVHIARDGVLLRSGGGGHRFAIVRLLGLPEIPVQIGAIHIDALRNGHVARLRRQPSLT